MTAVVAVLGPTAAGKTALALELAEQCGGEIVSADSALVYRGLDIGTAKPSPGELERVPHHLVDIRDLDEPFSLAEFQRLARQAIAEVHRRGHPVFLVGGTGLYIRALLEGYTLPDAPPDPDLRRRLGERPLRELVQELRERDPRAAELVDLANPRRVIRAIEVCLSTGRPFSSFYHRVDPGYRVLKLALRLPREQLFARIDGRGQDMLRRGLLEEVRGLVENGYAPQLRRLKLIGYEEMLDVLEGRLSQDEGLELLRRNTRRLAKRQMTWLRREPGVLWLEGAPESIAEAAREMVLQWLNSFRPQVVTRKET